MASVKIVGENLPNLPWQEKPAGSGDIMWRYDRNPVMAERAARRRADLQQRLFFGGYAGVFGAISAAIPILFQREEDAVR
jgi:beta-1,4-mannooligosaccharide/beta-1,4-mannosyl-N-acetylglucosamine phosphorylase